MRLGFPLLYFSLLVSFSFLAKHSRWGRLGKFGSNFEYGTTWAGRLIPLEDCELIYHVPLYLFLGNLLIIIILQSCSTCHTMNDKLPPWREVNI